MSITPVFQERFAPVPPKSALAFTDLLPICKIDGITTVSLLRSEIAHFISLPARSRHHVEDIRGIQGRLASFFIENGGEGKIRVVGIIRSRPFISANEC